MSRKILVTAALPYINNVQHLGHFVGCHLPADVFSRFQKSLGNDVVFVGGSDEHGTAVLISAKEQGMEPQELIDKLNALYKKFYEKLSIDYSIYSGTSTPVHKEVTQDFFKEMDKNGYILEKPDKMLFCEHDKIALADRFVVGTCPKCGFEGAYGDQCDKCGESYETSELINPRCKFCGQEAKMVDTKHLFFDMAKIQDKLDQWIESKKDIFRPHVYSEAKRWINEGLRPRAITRDIPWGIPVPKEGFENKVFYVWFDAPIGYISITKELGGELLVKDRWQNPECEIYNFIGKDNIQFHTVFFPAMEIACGKYFNAYNVVGSAFMNFEGQKFSKSKGIGIFCDSLLSSDIDIDTLRAYLVTVFPENKDSDFRWEGYRDNTNSELVGKFGNFFNRTLNMIYKNFAGALDFELSSETILDEFDKEIISAIKEFPDKIAGLFQKTEFREAYRQIMAFASVGNQYLEKTAPWTHLKNGEIDETKKILYLCLNLAKALCVVASPVLPNRTSEIWTEQLGFSGLPTDSGKWNEIGNIDIPKSHTTFAPKPLFARVDDERLECLRKQFEKAPDLKNL